MKIFFFLLLLIYSCWCMTTLMSHEQVVTAREHARDNFAAMHKTQLDRLFAELNANMSDVRRLTVATMIDPPFALHVLLAGLEASYDMEYDVGKRALTVDIIKKGPHLKLYEPDWFVEYCVGLEYGNCEHVEHRVYRFDSRAAFESKYALSKFYSF